MHTVYYLWALLPLGLFWVTIRSLYRRALKLHGEETAMEYFKQAVFCSAVLWLSIYLDQNFFDDIVDGLSAGMIDANVKSIIRWLVYPAVLTGLAQLQRWYAVYRGPRQDKLSKMTGSRLRYVAE